MSRLPPGAQWIGHCGKRAQLRYLRQNFSKVAKLKDADSIAARARLNAAVADDPEPVYAAMNLAMAAQCAAEDVRSSGNPCTWAESINHLLNMFEERASQE